MLPFTTSWYEYGPTVKISHLKYRFYLYCWDPNGKGIIDIAYFILKESKFSWYSIKCPV